jgi:hypothetical protein
VVSLDVECDEDDDGENDEADHDGFRNELVRPAVDAAELEVRQVFVEPVFTKHFDTELKIIREASMGNKLPEAIFLKNKC